MEIATEEAAGGIVIVRLAGDMRLSARQDISDRIRDTVHGLLSSGKRRLVFSMAEVTRIDSRGLGALARCQAAAIIQKADIVVVLGKGQVLDSLTQLNFIQVCQVYADEASALAALSSSGSA